MKDLSHWEVPDDYATRYMTKEAEFCDREATEARNRGCDDYVVDHYHRRAELLHVAVARLDAMCKIPCDWNGHPHAASDHAPLVDDREPEPTAAEEYEDRRDHERAHSAARLG